MGKSSIFDYRSTAWIFGVILPPILLVFDPAVFNSGGLGVGVLSEYKALGVTGTVLGVIAMAVELRLRERHGILAGSLAGGSLFALLLGIGMLPLALITVCFAPPLGLLGLVPLVAATVFWRRAKFAYRGVGPNRRLPAAVLGFALYTLPVLGVDLAATNAFEESVESIVSGEPKELERGIERLRRWSPLLDLPQLAWVWHEQEDDASRERLRVAFEELGEGDIELAYMMLVD